MYKIREAKQLTDNIFLMNVEAPRVAKHCHPGQFIIVKIDEEGERIPLTICDYDIEEANRHHRIPDRWSVHSSDVKIEDR